MGQTGKRFPARNASELTPRQADVLARLADRQSIKVIAAEIGISESAVNKHIMALKRKANANTLAELVGFYRRVSITSDTKHCRKTAPSKKPLLKTKFSTDQRATDDIEPVVVLQDGFSYAKSAPWSTTREPIVGPEVLNGTVGTWTRATAIAVITIGIFVMVIVGLGAAQSVTSALQGWQAASNTTQ